jgi:hypothetical protein
MGVINVNAGGMRKQHHRPIWIIYVMDLSKSTYVGTRKMVNYA